MRLILHPTSFHKVNAAQLLKSFPHHKPMDSQYELNRQFDEDVTERCRKFFLADPKLYLYRRYPELQEPEVILSKKGSQSVFDITGVRFKKTLENVRTEKFFACPQSKCFQKREVI